MAINIENEDSELTMEDVVIRDGLSVEADGSGGGGLIAEEGS